MKMKSSFCIVSNDSITKGIKLIGSPRYEDHRIFCTYNLRILFGNYEFVQDNCSFSKTVGTLRGLHFQAPPHAQAKLAYAVKAQFLMLQ